jgi:hypothetical protein
MHLRAIVLSMIVMRLVSMRAHGKLPVVMVEAPV